MPETVFYLRGFPPGFALPISDGMIRDAKIILGLEPEKIEAICRKIQDYPGFLNREALEELLTPHFTDKEIPRGLARFITAIHEGLREAEQTVEQFIANIENWLGEEENKEKGLLSQEEIAELRNRLPLVLQSFAGLERQAKARHLSEATGQPLEKIEIICDLRPVFDETREVIEGMFPYTTLKVICKGVDGLPVTLEAILSEKDVAGLAEASALAKKKLGKLQEHLAQKEIRMPPPITQ